MDIKFLRPELERLHARLHAVSTMRGTRLSVDAVDWEMWYAQSRSAGARKDVYPDLLLPYLTKHTPAPASVLYVGGGSADGVLPLAEAGYEVTALMPAVMGLQLVSQEAEAADVAERLSYVCGYAGDAPMLGEQAFDAVIAVHSIRVEKDLQSVLRGLLAVCRGVLCFDVMSRYGFLAGRMPGGYAYTAGYNPASMLHVLAEHETPGGRPSRHEQYPLYTFEEVSDLARRAGLQVDAVVPVDAREAFQWAEDSDSQAAGRLRARMVLDPVLRELGLSFLVLGRTSNG